MSRVLLHEHVGHHGMESLLKGNAMQERRFNQLITQIPEAELMSIAGQDGYRGLQSKPRELALEWLARELERRPDILQRQGPAQELWRLMREIVADWQARMGLRSNAGRSLDAQVGDLLERARDQAAKKGTFLPNASHPDVGPRFAYSIPVRQDKPTSWAAVKPGHRWMSAKGLIPKLNDSRPPFVIVKRGTFEEKVSKVARWLGYMPKIKDPWGGSISLSNPQTKGGFPTELENRAAHLLGENLDERVEKRTERPSKVEWIGAVQGTIEGAQVRVRQGSETLYFRSYAEGVHMVIVEEGIVKDQYGIVSQYAPDMNKRNFKDAVVEKVR
ncbi:hypothetical protein EI77_04740 [Prosthecobacter fusiformis]|uniref:Uncharacterized protein n=1 Tax=Prosthecobacter fusiformis TaxID=48464 RepID=A0A4R7RJ35_9BACT|nr:hypothetical protein [Prosthecobacter fusiformis]TDU62102.1 hypothetical protein EI77_04740 [Prosthecobacter fusiformis]